LRNTQAVVSRKCHRVVDFVSDVVIAGDFGWRI
jgi:hypothetical protein